MEKNKKKTLTISSNFKKKIDPSTISTSGKKSFLVDKKNLTPIDTPSRDIMKLIVSGGVSEVEN